MCFRSMCQRPEYADHLDHLWDLDEKDEKQKEFLTAIDELYDTISTVPEFFSFVAGVQEEAL